MTVHLLSLMQSKKIHKVSIVMGSQSDFKTMKLCQNVLKF